MWSRVCLKNRVITKFDRSSPFPFPHEKLAKKRWCLFHSGTSTYPLVNVYILLWKDPPFSMGKSTISTGPFSIAMLVITRGYIILLAMHLMISPSQKRVISLICGLPGPAGTSWGPRSRSHLRNQHQRCSWTYNRPLFIPAFQSRSRIFWPRSVCWKFV